MSKIQIPAEYKAFEDKFSALAYGQDDSKVFDDMLTFIIDLFSFDNPWKPHGRYKDPEIRKRFFEQKKEKPASRRASRSEEVELHDLRCFSSR